MCVFSKPPTRKAYQRIEQVMNNVWTSNTLFFEVTAKPDACYPFFILFYNPIDKLLYLFLITFWKEFSEATLKQWEKITKPDQEFHEMTF